MFTRLKTLVNRPRGNRRVRAARASTSASARLVSLRRWIVWLIAMALLIAAVVALLSFNAADPAWSTTGKNPVVKNWLGWFGAWASDIGYFVLGAAVWWLPAFVASMLWRTLPRRVLHANADDAGTEVSGVTLPWRICGLALLLLAGSALETVAMYRWFAGLPQGAGGALGQSAGLPLLALIGFIPSALLLIVFVFVGVTIAFAIPWLRFSERLGTLLLDGLASWREQRDAVREIKRDFELAAPEVELRNLYVQEELRRVDQHEPIKIIETFEPVLLSERVEREKQTMLFADIPDSVLPQLSLLEPLPKEQPVVSAETLEFTSRLIERKLAEFNVPVKVLAAYPGPVITRYEIEPDVGVKGNSIVNLAKDLARAMSVMSIRVVETIPGKSCMGLEVPNPQRQSVALIEILGSAAFNDASSLLTMGLGKDIAGRPVVADLGRMPHCLVAGTTGSGKSVGINQMILSLLYKAEPREVRLVLIDPKMLELSIYDAIPHLLCPVVTDMKLAANALNWCVNEMERRYRLLSHMGVRQLSSYNVKIRDAAAKGQPIGNPFSLTPDQPEPLEEMPFIVVVIDELADLMMTAGKKIEELIARLAQKARAAGIHLILATQRPSVDVITGLIKANVPTRIAFQVASKIDSRTILDQMGAEALLGRGDMLYMLGGTGMPVRVHGAFVTDDEVHRVVEHWKAQAPPQYVEGVLEGTDAETLNEVNGGGSDEGEKDPRFDEAVAAVLESRQPTISYVQRRLRIGYNGAARLIEAMENAGIVTRPNAMGKREVLVPKREE
ncbi:MAG: DNA translocase FtsK 4TM domain-containing protein [Rhizobacter sp.]|nr:DNA translocase FtsK 4TM domain-containing protein [Burkholderiales bacterium]